MPFESNYIPFWKIKNYGESKKSQQCQGLGAGGWVNSRAQKIFRAVKAFHVTLNGGYMSLYICQIDGLCNTKSKL